MWDQMDVSGPAGAGGFLQSPGGAGFGSPSTAGSGEKRAERIQNVVPVLCSAVGAVPPDSPLSVAGREVHMAVLCGKLDAIEQAATKVTYTISDHTGTVVASRFIDQDDASSLDDDLSEGMSCRMIVRLRPSKSGAPLLTCFHVEAVTPMEEELHRLEVTHAALKMKLAANLAAGGVAGTNGLGDGATGAAGLGGMDVPMVAGGGIAGITPQQQIVYALVYANQSQQGITKSELEAGVAGQLSRADVERIIEQLSNEGHIYNTCDDEHFKATDC